MTWRLEWTALAVRDLLAIPGWRTAARIDEAILRLAETGQGEFRRMVVDGQAETVILIAPYAVLVSRDRPRRTLVVRRIVRYAK